MNLGFVAGLRALMASRRVLDVIGHNLANQNTPGYSRQVALLGATAPTNGPGNSVLGTGVEVLGVNAFVNEALLGRIRDQSELDGRFTAEAALFADIEAAAADLGEGSLSKRLQAFFDGASEAGSAPEDTTRRGALVSTAKDLIATLHQRRADLLDQRDAAISQARQDVEAVNPLLSAIAELNARIKNLTALGQPSNDLHDQRDELAKEAARLIGATATPLQDGTLQVTAGNVTLVNGALANRLVSKLDVHDGLKVTIAKGNKAIEPSNGELGGLLGIARDFIPARVADLDRLANRLILETNRVHSTGIPATGSFTQLLGTNAFARRGNLDTSTIALADAGLPFDLKAGKVKFAVTDVATGDIRHYDITIDPRTTSAAQVVDRIRQIPGLTASFEGGRLRIDAFSGYRFDFSRRIDGDPVEGGTFGDSHAVAIGSKSFPLALTNGSSLTVAVNGGAPQTVTFNSGSFADISNATAAEVAAVFNAQVTGASASVVDGRLVIRGNTEGATSSLTINDGPGSPVVALGLPAGTVGGSDAAVAVRTRGIGADGVDHVYTFEPLSDGKIGVTPDLKVAVKDENGELVATLDVGAGYEPGRDIEFAPGLNVSFGAGSISSGANQRFDLEVPGETDTADFLPAFGLNSFFVGTDARNIDVDPTLSANPNRVAGGLFGGAGDGANFDRLAQLADKALDGLDDSTAGAFANGIAGAIGNASAGAKTALDTVATSLLALEDSRQALSGVNQDEEFVDLQRFQQMYQAAAKYLSVLNAVDQQLFTVLP